MTKHKPVMPMAKLRRKIGASSKKLYLLFCCTETMPVATGWRVRLACFHCRTAR